MSPHLLIFGFGFTAQFLTKKARKEHIQVTVTSRDSAALGFNSAFDCDVIHFSEDSVKPILATITHILISVPPVSGVGDPVLVAFDNLLKKYGNHIQWIGYLSSTSVYGDHQGAWVDESSQSIAPGELGNVRLSAEKDWMSFAQTYSIPLTIFRLAGIYGPQRNMLSRLMSGKNETVVKKGHFFSRIYVEDIVMVILAAIHHSKPGITIYNVADDEPAPSDVVEQYAASLLQRPPLTEVAYEQATLSPMAKAFYSQNKRVSNAKIKQELHIQLRYPNYKEGLTHLLQNKEDL